jgi:hypothetical protein
MHDAVRSVMLAGKGLLRWPGGEEPVNYSVTVGFDNAIAAVRVGPPLPPILQRPIRHGGIYLEMQGGRRLALNIAPNGYLSADGAIEKSIDGKDWWTDTTPWLPPERSDRFLLVMRAGPTQIFESHDTAEEAKAAYRTRQRVAAAEIRPASGRPIPLE